MTATANAHRVGGETRTTHLDAALEAYKFNPAQPRDLQGRWVRLSGYWTPDVEWPNHPLVTQTPLPERPVDKDLFGNTTVKAKDLLPGDVIDSADIGKSLGRVYEDNWVKVAKVTEDRLSVQTMDEEMSVTVPLDEPIRGDIGPPLGERPLTLHSDPVKDVLLPPPSMPVGAVPITGLPPDRTLAVAAIMDKYEAMLPGSMYGITKIETSPNYPNSSVSTNPDTAEANQIAAYNEADGSIQISGEYAASGEQKGWDASWANHWFTPCAKTNRPNYPIAHEMGHHVSLARLTPAQRIDFLRTIVPDQYKGLIPQFEEAAQIPPDVLANPDDWAADMYGQLWANYLAPAIAENSTYSTYNYKEAMAEAFASAVEGSPSKLGTKVRRWMKRQKLT